MIEKRTDVPHIKEKKPEEMPPKLSKLTPEEMIEPLHIGGSFRPHMKKDSKQKK